MRIGQQVRYFDAKGKRHEATITAIAGSGASGNKALDLAVDDGAAENVPHGADHGRGDGFWLLEGEEIASTARAPEARRRKREK